MAKVAVQFAADSLLRLIDGDRLSRGPITTVNRLYARLPTVKHLPHFAYHYFV